MYDSAKGKGPQKYLVPYGTRYFHRPSPFYTAVEDRTYYVITRGAYLQDYASYGYEISWVYRSHLGAVQCTGTITLACLIF